MLITKRLEMAAAEEEKDDGGKDVKMSGVEYAAIEPGDVSPGGMAIGNQLKASDEKTKVEEKMRQELMQELKKTKELRKNMKRQLTGHVVTRWYRAPELILLEKDYGPAIDMWSVGCIFAELLLRRPFLQGNQSDINQLNTIFRVFGTPTDENWPDHKALPLPSRGLLWDDCPPIPFDEIFTAAPKDALSLLRSMLVLDPNKRFSASQCLIHPYFTNDPRPTSNEKLLLDSPIN